MDQGGNFRGATPRSRERGEIFGAYMRLSLVYWLVLLAVLTALALMDGWESWATFGARLFMTGFSVTASWVIVRLVNRMNGRSFPARVILVCALVVLIASIHYTVSTFAFRTSTALSTMMLAQTLRNILFWVGTYLGWAALFLAQQYAAQVVERERQLSELREQAFGAQIRALRYQINPHFLFNTLNALATLIEEGEARNAERMVLSLSTFLRSTLALDPMQDVTLAEELDIQARYLDVERERYSDRLTVVVDIPPELTGARVPSLILQPLVENAVKHGVGALDRPVQIRVRAEAENGVLSVHVDNDAPEVARAAPGTGTGIRNVAERLATRFGDAASFTSGRVGDGLFRATISLPLRYAAS